MAQTATLNPTQIHLLMMFAFNSSEEYAREVQDVLTQHFLLTDDHEAAGNWKYSVDDRTLFNYYYKAWQQQTKFLSSVSRIRQNQAFRKIVDMGGNAVPYILEEIERQPSTLVWALNEIFHKKIGQQNTVTEACRLWINMNKPKLPMPASALTRQK